MNINELVQILCCPCCKSNLEITQHMLICRKCSGKVLSTGRLLDFRALVPQIPLHFARYTQKLHEQAGQTMPDIPIDGRVQAILDKARMLGAGDVCLEIGGADGVMTQCLESLYTTVLSLDFGMSFLERVEKKTKKTICLCGDTHFLPLRDRSVNLVVCSEVLEHVAVPTQLMLEIRRVLTSGGKCILSVPNEETLNFLMTGRKTKQIPGCDSHVTFYTAATLRKFLFRMGFDILEFRYLSAPLKMSISPRKIISSLKGMLFPSHLFCLIQPMKRPDIYWESLSFAIGSDVNHGILNGE